MCDKGIFRSFHNASRIALLVSISICGSSCSAVSENQSPEQTLESFSLMREMTAVGRTDSLPGQALNAVRGAVWVQEGLLVVANGGTGELRIFDLHGDLVRILGRFGAGPGEFQMLTSLWTGPGDSLVAYDRRLSRLSYWSVDGSLLREARVDGKTGLLAALPNGYFLGARVPLPVPVAANQSRVDTASLMLIAEEGPTSEIVRIPWQTMFGAVKPNREVLTTMLPFQPHAQVAIGPSTIYVGYPSRWRVERYSLSGAFVTSVLLDRARREFTEELKAAWQKPFLKRVGFTQRPEMRRYLDALPYPDSLPAYDMMLVDQLDYLWLREFAVLGEDSSTWLIVPPDNRSPATLHLPTELRPVQIGRDFIVSVVSSDRNGDQVVVKSLRRPAK